MFLTMTCSIYYCFSRPVQTGNVWRPNILPFGHLVWYCLIFFYHVWSCLIKFEGHETFDKTTCNIYFVLLFWSFAISLPEPTCLLVSAVSWRWPKDRWALGTTLVRLDCCIKPVWRVHASNACSAACVHKLICVWSHMFSCFNHLATHFVWRCLVAKFCQAFMDRPFLSVISLNLKDHLLNHLRHGNSLFAVSHFFIVTWCRKIFGQSHVPAPSIFKIMSA